MRATSTNRQSIKITRNIENIRLIYLNHSPVDAQLQSRLIQISPAAQFYTDIRLSIDFLKTNTNEQFFFIISNDSDILDSISSFPSILAIFIYDTNAKQPISDDLRRKYPKIIDQYSNENHLFKSLEDKIQLIEKQTIIYSLFNPKQTSTRYLTKESASFLWYQMLIPILKQIPQNSNIHHDEFFRQNYIPEQAIQWYTKEYFLSKLFNRALRMKNIEMLYSFGFVILDLCLEIQREYEHMKNQGNLIVYRAQLMSKEEIEKLKNNLGSLICINEFFMTSRDRNSSLEDFTQHFSIYEHVLFEIHVDLSIKTILLVDIPSLNKILFSINSLFRIESIEYDVTNQLWNVKILASDDGIKYIDDYLKTIQMEMDYHSPMIYFGHLLWNELQQIEQAEYFFQILLKLFPNDHENLPSIYMELGGIHDEIREYNTALNYYQNSLDIRQKQIPKDSIQIALVLNNIGLVYKHMGDIDRAIEFYQQALSMEDITDRNKANIMRNIGLIYRDKQDWTNALKYFNQTFEIHQCLSSNVDLAICYGDIGYIYEKMNNLDFALDNYQRQYQIEENYFPIDHPNLIQHFDWIINIFKKKDQIDQAIEFCQGKLSQYENHPRVLILLATMYEDKNPKEADQYYQRALTILEQYKTDEIFAKSLSTMTNFYWKCRMFDRALICQMKLLHFRRSTLLSNHNDIAYTLRGLARLYRAMNKSTEALQYFEQSLAILQTNYGSEHVDVKNMQKEIFDLKDILKSISSSPKEDYNNRRISNTQKQLSTISKIDSKSSSSTMNSDMNNKPSTSVTCSIL